MEKKRHHILSNVMGEGKVSERDRKRVKRVDLRSDESNTDKRAAQKLKGDVCE
jgi:hypothetical protein